MLILAIETSCDETAISFLEIKNKVFKILSSVVSSQVKIHAKWGGVVPSLAKREHLKNLPIVLKKVLKQAQIKNPEKEIDLLAVTNGPGLEPALWTGINFAEELAKKWNKKILPINHMEGHLFSVFLEGEKFSAPKLKFPAIVLLVSGGHTELVLTNGFLKYKRLGHTRDDAAGEAFDKVAKMLNLGYPGGPVISELASQWLKRRKSILESKNLIKFPRPMINSKDYDFSFSGLKTAVLYKIKEFKKLTPNVKKEICHEFQQAVVNVLISKTTRAAREYKAKTIIVAGGVTANKELREQFSNQQIIANSRVKLLLPKIQYTGDNAAMIALAAYFRQKKKSVCKRTVKADGNLKIS